MGKDRAGNRLNSRLNYDLDAGLRPQRQNRQHLNLVIGIELEPEPLSNRRQQQHDLHHRKIIPDTLSWSTTKREVSVLRHEITIDPSLRLKRIGLVEVT